MELPSTGKSSMRQCIRKNHKNEREAWLIHYKKHTGKEGLSLNDAVEEAICFGWIDGKLKRVDDKKNCSVAIMPSNAIFFY